jgi:hypothetical protein
MVPFPGHRILLVAIKSSGYECAPLAIRQIETRNWNLLRRNFSKRGETRTCNPSVNSLLRLKNLPAASGLAYPELGAIRTSSVVPNAAPKLLTVHSSSLVAPNQHHFPYCKTLKPSARKSIA